MSVAEYRNLALSAALNPQHPLHLLPAVPEGAHRILEVGCHAGHILEAMRLPDDCEAFGCDIDREALEVAKQCVPNAHFEYGAAECLPFENSFFDFLFARGVVVCIDIPKALFEFNRVLRLGAKLWLSLYRWRDCWVIWRGTWKPHPIKTVLFGAYTFINSELFRHTGKLFHYPLNRGRMLSFQSEMRMQKELEKAGFGAVIFSREKYLVVEAEKVRDAL